MISFDDFAKVELKVGTVLEAEDLEPRTMMGLQSQGMMLAADSKDGPVFLTVPKKVSPGTKIR